MQYKSIMMIRLKTIITLLILLPTSLLAGNEDSIDYPSVSDALEKLKNTPASNIRQQDGWSIISLIENGNNVIWYIAPEEHDAYPAVIKKTVFEKGSGIETVILTLCEAAKAKCDALTSQFKKINNASK